MASIPLPALAIKQPENPLDTDSKIIGLKGAMLQKQGQEQQNQIYGSQLQDIQQGRAVLSDLASQAQSTGKPPTLDDITQTAGKHNLSATATNAILTGYVARQKDISDIAKNDALPEQASRLAGWCEGRRGSES